MQLSDGKIGDSLRVLSMNLPANMEKRLEALGMTIGSEITILNSKSDGVLIVKIRGTRFALGRNLTKNVEVR